jgi:hypothetical protein
MHLKYHSALFNVYLVLERCKKSYAVKGIAVIVWRFFAGLAAVFIIGCSVSSESGIAFQPIMADNPTKSCAESLESLKSVGLQYRVVDTKNEPCLSVTDVARQLTTASIAYDMSSEVPRPIVGDPSSSVVILTGGAERFWKANCNEIHCFIDVSHEIQTSYVKFLERENLQSKTIIFVDAIASSEKHGDTKNVEMKFKAEAILRAMFRRLEIASEQRFFVEIVKSNVVTKS